MMKEGSKSKCESSYHGFMKEKAKNRVDDLQGIFINLQSARKESRVGDIVVLEEQMHQILREWKAELNEPSPASSLVDGSLGSFPEELAQLLHQIEEEDDASSAVAKPGPLKIEPQLQNHNEGNFPLHQEECFNDKQSQDHPFMGFDQSEGPASTLYNNAVNTSDMANQLDHHQFDFSQDFDHGIVVHNSDLIDQFNLYQDNKSIVIENSNLMQFVLHENFDGLLFGADYTKQASGEDTIPYILPDIRPPPSAFLQPQCALWDCSRPAQGSKWCQDYCSSCHKELASNEEVGATPVLRPGGIVVNDGLLFSALGSKTQGKEVGIPKCEGAASTKAPWNAPELFDLSLLDGEKLREWLFFDKPRRAFESGNRKQRSLPDYTGRGWHESRKQVMEKYGGQKRSYYMDPQPLSYLEWHLYEYELFNNDGCALYRLELKLVDKKKSAKGKVTRESLADLQNKMGKLTADVQAGDEHPTLLRKK